MTDISSLCTYTICEAGSALRRLLIETTTNAAGSDTIALTLATYGISDLMTIQSIIESTAGSVFADSTCTTTISAGVLTITLGTGTSKKYNIIIEGR